TANSVVVGAYSTWALPPGNYLVRTSVGAPTNLIDQVWNTSGNLPCAPCAVTIGTPVAVVGTANTPNINFPLSAGGSISGTATDPGSGGGVCGRGFVVFDQGGLAVKNAPTDASGNYPVAGLPAGNYMVRTNPNATFQNYVTQVYNGIAFEGLPNFGTPVD